jgi:hypothetical protein
MKRMARVAGLVFLIGAVGVAGYLVGIWHTGATTAPIARASSPDRDDLRTMYEQDQADRSGGIGHTDWAAIEPRDRTRRERARALVGDGLVTTANDYYRAAMILQHGNQPEDFILAHDLAVVGAINGQRDARWLAAATEDRFLRAVGRAQRFGTQFRKDGDGPWYLESVQAGVPDVLRVAMDVPPLAEAASRVAEMNKSK